MLQLSSASSNLTSTLVCHRHVNDRSANCRLQFENLRYYGTDSTPSKPTSKDEKAPLINADVSTENC